MIINIILKAVFLKIFIFGIIKSNNNDLKIVNDKYREPNFDCNIVRNF